MNAKRAEQALGLPDGTLSREVRIELIGRRKLTAEGCRRLLEYEDGCIRFETVSGTVRLTGDGLRIDRSDPTVTVITGRFLAIEFL